MADPFDLAIVGGGVNGCGIARDAAGRGLSVFLCERNDFASATSSASTKLIHGGLRYLEHFEFRLVREALIEREILLHAAPHIIWPLRFVLPHHKGMRPAWFLRLGLFVYDHLGGRKRLPGTRTLDLRRDPVGQPLNAQFTRAFEYSDCWVEDSRLVVLNALDAAERGAELRNNTECLSATRIDRVWRLDLRDGETGVQTEVRAKALVNAAGPWAGLFVQDRVCLTQRAPVRLVKGSHIIVPRLFDHAKAYIFQNSDGRIVFAIPYETYHTLIGTTDVEYDGDPGQVRIGQDEIAYLCAAAGAYFKRPIAPGDVTASYSGVRPLYDDGSADAKAVTRDYVLKLETAADAAPLLNIYGGKLTTYRMLAEAVLERLRPHLPAMGVAWTADAPLPGGDFPVDGFEAEVAAVQSACPVLESTHARRLVRAYGTRAQAVIKGVRSRADLGQHFGADLFAREVAYLMDTEWARTADDVVWRRSKLGLAIGPEGVAHLEAWMRARRHANP